jgi:hypothetical protein
MAAPCDTTTYDDQVLLRRTEGPQLVGLFTGTSAGGLVSATSPSAARVVCTPGGMNGRQSDTPTARRNDPRESVRGDKREEGGFMGVGSYDTTGLTLVPWSSSDATTTSTATVRSIRRARAPQVMGASNSTL